MCVCVTRIRSHVHTYTHTHTNTHTHTHLHTHTQTHTPTSSLSLSHSHTHSSTPLQADLSVLRTAGTPLSSPPPPLCLFVSAPDKHSYLSFLLHCFPSPRSLDCMIFIFVCEKKTQENRFFFCVKKPKKKSFVFWVFLIPTITCLYG